MWTAQRKQIIVCIALLRCGSVAAYNEISNGKSVGKKQEDEDSYYIDWATVSTRRKSDDNITFAFLYDRAASALVACSILRRINSYRTAGRSRWKTRSMFDPIGRHSNSSTNNRINYLYKIVKWNVIHALLFIIYVLFLIIIFTLLHLNKKRLILYEFIHALKCIIICNLI